MVYNPHTNHKYVQCDTMHIFSKQPFLVKEDGHKFVVLHLFSYGKQRKQNADLLILQPLKISCIRTGKWSMLNYLLISRIIKTVWKNTFPLSSIYSMLKEAVVQSTPSGSSNIHSADTNLLMCNKEGKN